MSEAELHFLRARLRGGILSKARRGELPTPLPVGLVDDPAGKVVLDPDQGVQQALRHLFASFERTGSARAVVQAFECEGLRFPVRIRSGKRKGELLWMPLRHWRVLRTLHNPRYTGAFVYGRHRTSTKANGKTTVHEQPREQWIFIADAHPGYISLERYETNQRVLAGNAHAHGVERAAGPAREGPALLQGLVVCGKCGKRMTVSYHKRRNILEFPRFCGVLSTCGESVAVRMDSNAQDKACLSGAVPAGGAGTGPSGPLDPGRGGEPGGVAADAAQLASPGRARSR